MFRLNRRHALAGGASLAGLAALGARPALSAIPTAEVALPNQPIEKGATLRVLRPAKFVQGDETLWLENSKKFTEATGVPVTVDSEGWEDLRPKTAVAANVGSGPDIILAWQEDPFLFEDKLADLTELNTYLGKKYGGWFDLAKVYGMSGDRWISMPVGGSGSTMVHRRSWVQEAGYESVPKDFPGFLAMCKALQAKGHPVGFALGNAVGDGGWTDWVLWGYGSSLVDENDQVVIDNPKTVEALEYAKELYATFIPGTLSWLDPSNNKAFLAGEISLTTNGISVYYAAKTSDDATLKAMAEDIYHADFPIGPVGFPTQGALVINSVVMNYTPYPNAAKEYLRFMMEAPQYTAWQTASIGYWCHPLAAFDHAEIWTSDPKIGAYRNIIRNGLPQSYKGRPSPKAAAAKADLVVLNMFQSVCAGQQSPQDAAKEAQKRGERYYKA
ncbi:MAG TPA: ABC transporter substrate-binding protein [Geminicoccaceae bacterium]|nr:ABC transporter substrate-binding protein [Geminicoccus sp.]HMU48192.1 ABC transporter substrate-binding protein [Geminicoccaceae bacterium]